MIHWFIFAYNFLLFKKYFPNKIFIREKSSHRVRSFNISPTIFLKLKMWLREPLFSLWHAANFQSTFALSQELWVMPWELLDSTRHANVTPPSRPKMGKRENLYTQVAPHRTKLAFAKRDTQPYTEDTHCYTMRGPDFHIQDVGPGI